jgi:hypothetical protein
VKYEASINSRNAIVAKSATNEMLNETTNYQNNEILIGQTSKEKEEMKNSSRLITFSE